MLEQEREGYAGAWAATSASINKRAAYTWFAEQLAPYDPKRIFDVGCGSGLGVSALLNQFPDARIVSIDENRHCINIAHANIIKFNSIDAHICRRLTSIPVKQEHLLYKNEYTDISYDEDNSVCLIEGDLLDGIECYDALIEKGMFDGLTVWLAGAHPLKVHASNFEGYERSPYSMRILTQNYSYDLANRIVRPGGFIHLIDREEAGSVQKHGNDILSSHREQAEGTSFEPVSVAAMPYVVDMTEERVILYNNKTEQILPASEGLEFVSVISIKR